MINSPDPGGPQVGLGQESVSKKSIDPSVGGLIPYNNLQAIVALILAGFSVIPMLGVLFALVALPLGIFGLRKTRKDPSYLGKAHSWIAICISGLAILVWGGVLIALVFFMPRKHCRSVLRLTLRSTRTQPWVAPGFLMHSAITSPLVIRLTVGPVNFHR